MKKYIISSFRGGISKYKDRGLAGAFQYGRNLNFRTDDNTLTCNQDLTQEGSRVIADLINFFVPSITGKLYAFGDSGKIYERDSAGTWTLKYTDPDGEIKGAAEWYQENGNTYLFWATDTKLHSKELPGASDWSDVDANIVVGSTTYTYPKTNLLSAAWHTMKQALGDLYIANDNKLAMVGYDGSFTTEALSIFFDESLKSLLERDTYILFGTARQDGREISHLYQWDTISSSWNGKKVVFKGDVNAIIDTDIGLAQVGTDGGIFYADMVTPLLIRTIDGGGQSNPGGVDVDEGLALFGIYGNSNDDNGIYSYGRTNKDENHVFNLEHYLGSVDKVGAIVNFDNKIFVSYKSGSSYYVKRTDDNNKATGVYRSLQLIPDKQFINQYLWRVVKVYMKPLPAGCEVGLTYKTNRSGSFKSANLEGGLTSFSTIDGTEAVFLVGDKANIFEFELTLTPNGNYAPEIERIEVYFD